MEKNNLPILVMMPNNPGDVVMALYLVNTLFLQSPAPIHFLVDQECQTLVNNHPQIQKVWVIPRKSMQSDYVNSWEPFHEFLNPLLKLKFQKSINLFQGRATAILQTLLKAPSKVGAQINNYGELIVPDFWSQYLFAIPTQRAANQFHCIDLYHRMAGILPKEPPSAQFPEHPFPINATNSIAIQIGSAWKGKKWPLKNWNELISQLILQFSTIYFLGSPDESDEIVELIAQIPANGNCINLAGKTNLCHTPTILKQCQALITGDTFAMHVSAAVSIPVYALFGPSSLRETGPYSNQSTVFQIVTKLNSTLEFTNNDSLRRLSPQAVAQAIIKKDHFDFIWVGEWDQNRSKITYRNQSNWSSIYKGIDTQEYDEFMRDSKTKRERLTKLLKSSIELKVQTHFAEIEVLENQLALISPNLLRCEIYRMQLNQIDPFPLESYLIERLYYLLELEKDLPQLSSDNSHFTSQASISPTFNSV